MLHVQFHSPDLQHSHILTHAAYAAGGQTAFLQRIYSKPWDAVSQSVLHICLAEQHSRKQTAVSCQKAMTIMTYDNV